MASAPAPSTSGSLPPGRGERSLALASRGFDGGHGGRGSEGPAHAKGPGRSDFLLLHSASEASNSPETPEGQLWPGFASLDGGLEDSVKNTAQESTREKGNDCAWGHVGARLMGGHFVNDACTHCVVHSSLMEYVNWNRKVNKAFSPQGSFSAFSSYSCLS